MGEGILELHSPTNRARPANPCGVVVGRIWGLQKKVARDVADDELLF